MTSSPQATQLQNLLINIVTTDAGIGTRWMVAEQEQEEETPARSLERAVTLSDTNSDT